MALEYECPECEKVFAKEHSLDQHMAATGHEYCFDDDFYCDDDCTCDDCCEDDWDDDKPSVDLSIFKPKKQASKKTLRIAGKCLSDPDNCTIPEVKQMAASHLSIGRNCSYGICGNSAKIDCDNDSCAEHCPGCSVH